MCPVTSRTIKNINEGVSLETVKELMSIKLLENIWITVKERDADFWSVFQHCVVFWIILTASENPQRWYTPPPTYSKIHLRRGALQCFLPTCSTQRCSNLILKNSTVLNILIYPSLYSFCFHTIKFQCSELFGIRYKSDSQLGRDEGHGDGCNWR